jgi:hypothetical protein
VVLMSPFSLMRAIAPLVIKTKITCPSKSTQTTKHKASIYPHNYNLDCNSFLLFVFLSLTTAYFNIIIIYLFIFYHQ